MPVFSSYGNRNTYSAKYGFGLLLDFRLNSSRNVCFFHSHNYYLPHIFSTADLRETDLMKAADSDTDDYENAIHCVCASRIKADYIVTRNVNYSEIESPSIQSPAKNAGMAVGPCHHYCCLMATQLPL